MYVLVYDHILYSLPLCIYTPINGYLIFSMNVQKVKKYISVFDKIKKLDSSLYFLSNYKIPSLYN